MIYRIALNPLTGIRCSIDTRQAGKEEKLTFMFGDSEERAERKKHQTQRWFESLAREKRATDARSSRLGAA